MNIIVLAFGGYIISYNQYRRECYPPQSISSCTINPHAVHVVFSECRVS